LKQAMLASRPLAGAGLRWLLVLTTLLTTGSPMVMGGDPVSPPGAESTLVRVDFTTQRHGGDAVEINGRRVPDYHPRIVRVVTSPGVVMDDQSHILTFLGYRWVDILSPKPVIHVMVAQGVKSRAKLVGIDQSVGVAVVQAEARGLSKTPVCEQCPIEEGASVVTIAPLGAELPRFQSLEVLSVGQGMAGQPQQGWEVTVKNRLPNGGGPLLDAEHRVLGFVAGQQIPSQDPAGVRTIVFPISQLLSSARRILQVGGDIRTGWLGVFLTESSEDQSNGVLIRSVLKDSPASKAGLLPDDRIVKWNGRRVLDPRQFIQMVQDTPIGSRATLDLVRAGQSISVAASIEARRPHEENERFELHFPAMNPFAAHAAATPLETRKNGAAGMTGITTVRLTAQLADFLQMPGRAGLLVSDVRPDTPFAKAGIRVGDVIVSVDEKPVLDPQAFASLLGPEWSKRRLVLQLLRRGSEFTITLQIP